MKLLWQYLAEFFSEWDMFQTKLTGNQNKLYDQNFFLKTVCLWDNVVKYGRDGQATDDNIIWHVHIVCWIIKATNAHSKYVILVAFPRQRWLQILQSSQHWCVCINVDYFVIFNKKYTIFVFAQLYCICSRNLRTFFSILAAEKSGCVKYADFFVEVLIWVFSLYNWQYGTFFQYFIVIL